MCDHLKVNYNEKSETSLIEENMLSSILQKSLEKMSDEEIRELCDELGVKNTNKLGKQALSTAALTLFRMGGFKILSISFNCCKCRDKGDFSKRVVSRGKCRSYKRAKHFNRPCWLDHYRRMDSD